MNHSCFTALSNDASIKMPDSDDLNEYFVCRIDADSDNKNDGTRALHLDRNE